MPVGLCLSRFCCARQSLFHNEFVKEEYILNKNTVYLIDDIFWNMPFKNPTHSDRVIMLIIFTMLVMRIMIIKDDYAYSSDDSYFGNYADYTYYGSYVYYADYFVNSGQYRFGSCGSRVAEQAYHHLVGLNTLRTLLRPGRRRGQSAHPLDRG
jgi:hypothetical protein